MTPIFFESLADWLRRSQLSGPSDVNMSFRTSTSADNLAQLRNVDMIHRILHPMHILALTIYPKISLNTP